MSTTAESPRPAPPWISLFTLLLALLLVGALGAAAIALERPTGQVRGQVAASASGKPLTSAKVVVSGPVTRTLLTGPDGRFHFFNLPVGTYYVSAKSSRFDPQWQENGIKVVEGETVDNLDFKLARTRPSLEASNSQRVFTPGEKVRIALRGTDVPHVEATLYKLDLAKAVQSDPELAFLRKPDLARLRASKLITPLKTWRHAIHPEDLGDDDWFFKSMQIDDATTAGGYMLALSAQPLQGPEDAKPLAAVTDTHWFNVSRVALVAKRSAGQTLVYGVDLVDKRPIANLNLQLHDVHRRLSSAKTDARGLATLNTAGAADSLWVVGTHQGSLAISAAGWSGERSAYRVYGFTERPVYRPGQRVNYKAMVRAEDEARFASAAGQTVHITVKDATMATVFSEPRTVSATSSLDGSFELAEGASLGEYTLEFHLPRADVYQSVQFKVSDYRKPEYKVEFTASKPRFVQGESARVNLLTSYYFGAPVPGAKLQITVYSAPWYGRSDSETDFFSGYVDMRGYEPVWGYGDVVTQSEAVTDAQGQFTLDVPLAVTEPDAEGWQGDHVYTVAVEAIDASGRPVKGTHSFPVTQGRFRVTGETDQYLYIAKQPITVAAEIQDYDGKPVATDVTLSVERVEQVPKKSPEGDEYEETRYIPVTTVSARTDASGRASLRVPAPGEGDYVLRLSAKDSDGHIIRDRMWAWVSAAGDPMATEPQTHRYGSLQVVTDRKVYKPGQTARVLVISPVPNVSALITVEGTRIHDARVVRLKGTSALVEIPVTEAYKPNAHVAACIVNGKEFLEADRSLNVLPEDKFLDVKIASDKPRYEPGDTATYTVEARDHRGRPVVAEVALGIVDQAIYAIEPERTPDIKHFFHGPNWNTVRTSYSFAEDYSGGLDKFAPDPRVRAKFEDTAAWYPALRTGADGKASVSFKLPDNLTTWVATAHAATLDTRVGSATQTAVATKDLLVRLETPRFVVMGDRVIVSAIAHSYLDDPQDVALTLELEGLTMAVPATQHVTLAPGDAKRVTWEVETPKTGDVKARIIARGPRGGDAMELTFPALAYGTDAFTAFAGAADRDKPGYASFDLPTSALAGSAALELRLHTSPLQSVLAAVDYLHGYEYGCIEQTMSRFLPDAALQPRLAAMGAPVGDRFDGHTKRMATGIQRLVSLQHGDGGWGWWENDESQVEMTAYVLYGLSEARGAGQSIPPTTIRRAIERLQRDLPKLKKDVFTRNSVKRGGGADARAFALFALSAWDADPAAEISRLWSDRADLSNYGAAQLALTLARRDDSRRIAALDALRARKVESETHVHWDSDAAEFAWQDNAVETTAYALRAWLAIAPNDPLVLKTARWLESRNARGHWDSTKDTGAAALALTELMKARGAATPGGTTIVKLNDEEVMRFSPGAQDPFAAPAPLKLGGERLRTGPNRLEVVYEGDNGGLDFAGGLSYMARADQSPPSSSHGLSLSREYFHLSADVYARAKGQGSFSEFYQDAVVAKLKRLGPSVKAGERVLVKLTLKSDRPMRYMALEDPLPAGCEVLEDQPDNWSYWWSHQEYRDEKAAFFFNHLSVGEKQLYYVMRPTIQGQYRVLPSTVWAMYTPEVRARGASAELAITD